MKEQYIVSGYKITTDPEFQSKEFGVTPELQRQLEDLYYEVQDKNNKKIIDKLTNLIIEYPTVPILKNYLSVAYNVRKNFKKSKDVNEWILAEHPDYLYGKLNQANLCIENEELGKVEEILGKQMDLKALYPERETFHLTEVTSYLKTVIRYFVAIENQELAENRLDLLKKLAPDHHDTEEAEEFLYRLRLKNASARFAREEEKRITPEIRKKLPFSKKSLPPQFIHNEINDLYTHGLQIPREKLKAIINLPHDTLVKDLETVLQDAAERYHYFKAKKWNEERNSFPLHAIFILAEIRAKESLQQIFSFLSYDKDFLEYWLGDHITSTIWQSFYHLGNDCLDEMKEFLLRPGIYTYSKTSLSVALCQMVRHNAEIRDKIVPIYSEVYKKFAEAEYEDNLIDTDFLGLSIIDIMNCKLHELYPEIQELFKKEYVNEETCGDLKVVEHALFTEELKNYSKYTIRDIYMLYDNVLHTWYGYKDDNEKKDNLCLPQVNSSKVGRNDPCPCGSGKKYKKCCMNKDEE